MKFLREYIRGLLTEMQRQSSTPGKRYVYRGMQLEMSSGKLASQIRQAAKNKPTDIGRDGAARLLIGELRDEAVGVSWSLNWKVATKFSQLWRAEGNRGKTLHVVFEAVIDEEAGYDPLDAHEEPWYYGSEQEVRFKPGAPIGITAVFVYFKPKDKWAREDWQFARLNSYPDDNPIVVKA